MSVELARQLRRDMRAAAALDPAHLEALAGELDVAGDALKVMAARNPRDNGRAAMLHRAAACYGAAKLLRRIAK